LETTAIFFPLTASIFFGSQYLPQKKLGDVNTGNYNLSMIIGIFIISAVVFIIFYLIEMPILNWIPMILGLISGLIWQLGNRLSIIGINKIGMSKTTILLNLVSVFSFLLGVILFSELVSIYKIIGLPIITIGAIFVAHISNEEKRKLDWIGILSVIISSILISIFNVLQVESMSSTINPIIPFYATVFFLTIGSFFGSLLFNIKLKKLKGWYFEGKKFHIYASIGGMIWAFGILFTSFTLVNYGMTFGVPIIQTFMIITSSLWGILYFKEIRGRKLILFLIGLLFSIIGIILFAI